MSANSNGHGGTDVTIVAVDKTEIVGGGNPNKFPNIKIDPLGGSSPTLVPLKNGPAMVSSDPKKTFKITDTSWLSHTGLYTIYTGNKFVLWSGGGGVDINTKGPIRINSVGLDAIFTHPMVVKAQTYLGDFSGNTKFLTNLFEVEANQIKVQGTPQFFNNAFINGGLAVKGELFATHITTEMQLNTTEYSDDVKATLNPNASFLVFDGASAAAKSFCACPKDAAGLPDKPGFVTGFIVANIPGLSEVQFPCKIAFPNGISLCSDKTWANPTCNAQQIATQAASRTPNPDIHDVFGPGHMHAYYGPACSYEKDTAAIYQAMGQCLQNEPIQAKKKCTNGHATLDQAINAIKQQVTRQVKKYVTNMFKKYIMGVDVDASTGG